jgi:glycosyltransferase involved in cell wall biosynthesis
LKVGYSIDGYLTRRNIINIVPHYDYVKVHDINKILYRLAKINQKILNLSMPDVIDISYRFNDLNLNKVDLFHFFNSISYGKTPWVTSFESIVPRFRNAIKYLYGEYCDCPSATKDRKIFKAIETLCGNSCKKLIAISECSLNMQKDFLSHFPEYKSEIETKLIYLHPPQKVYVENYENKQLPLNKQIHFMFVGDAFFRKGGVEMLEAFIELRQSNNYNIKLTIVSSLIADNYAITKTIEEVEKTKEIINKNSNWIDFYSHLPNSQVIKIMKSAHVGLLPTYTDTYGFSVLEFQASGCPVITTNVRALPEINNNEMGWIIEIPRNRFGEAIYNANAEDKDKIGLAIKEELVNVISEIMENRDLISCKADNAIKHIREHHSPEEYSRKIREIYSHALE